MGVPDLHGPFPVRGGEPGAVGTIHESVDGSWMPSDGVDNLVGGRVIDLNSFVMASRRQPGTIGAVRHVYDVLQSFRSQGKPFLAGLHVPDLDGWLAAA